MKYWTRKEFLKASLIGGGAALFARRRLSAAAIAPGGSPNGDVRIAIVGINNKGAAHIRDFSKVPGVKITALCDVDRGVLARRADDFEKDHDKVARYADYRKLLDDPSIDAVVIATPNHWHSLMTVWGCQAGKDVYVEKPISHNVWEGGKAVEAARKYNRIVQAGTQSRSAVELQQAAAYIREGNLGKILWARGLCYKPRESIGRTSGPQPVPPGLDYDLWSGPAPLVPPRRNTSHGTVHYDWHWFWNYGGGDIANQGLHQMDICRWFLGQTGLPPTVMSLGGRFGYVDDAETPNTQIAVLGYEPAPIIFEVRGLPRKAGDPAMDDYRERRIGIVIQCENGYFAAGQSGGGFVYDNAGARLQPFTGPGGDGHMQNFIDAVRSRNPSDLAAPIEEGHISSALSHIANISHRLGQPAANEAIKEALRSDVQMQDSFARMLDHLRANNVDLAATPLVAGPVLKLEPGRESFVSGEKFDLGYWANAMLKRQYRKPFIVPDKV